MDKLRSSFEKIPLVKDTLETFELGNIQFIDGEYVTTLYTAYTPEYIFWLNGAWFGYKEALGDQ